MNCQFCKERLVVANKTLMTTSCGHALHQECFDDAISKGCSNCPVCKKSFNVAQRAPNVVPANSPAINQPVAPIAPKIAPAVVQPVAPNVVPAIPPAVNQPIAPAIVAPIAPAVVQPVALNVVPAIPPAVNQPVAPTIAPAVVQPVAPNVVPAILPEVPVTRSGKRVRRVKSVGITISRDVPSVRSQRRAISVGAIMVCRQSTRIKRQTKPFNIGIITCIVCQKTFRENIHDGRTVCSLKCYLINQRG